MAKHRTAAGKVGRPKSAVPKDVQLRIRVDQPTSKALESYRAKHLLGDRSDAVRHIIGKAMRAEGLL